MASQALAVVESFGVFRILGTFGVFFYIFSQIDD
jgi:hypothetical protein